jgi:hypothetical protein
MEGRLLSIAALTSSRLRRLPSPLTFQHSICNLIIIETEINTSAAKLQGRA